MKKFCIKTLGCKTNQIESDFIIEQLKGAGYEYSKNQTEADIFILNSCSVTSNADSEAVRILRKAKKDNPSTFVVLTGCMAQLEADAFEKCDYIDLVLGNSEKMNIVDYLKEQIKINVSDIFNQKEFIYKEVLNPTKTRAYLKIQDGCNNRCSYCTIWRARGYSRSNSVENIQKQIQLYVDHGFKEVVLTGIHTGQWGKDLTPRKSFLDLVKIVEDTDIKRFRLGSLDPFELSEELIDYLATSTKFCPHFHLSLQSACNKILKTMNRHYTVEHYLAQIDKINDKFNLPFIGCDIIVGFPGETEDDFETTYSNIERSGLTMAHIFPYSIRKNTKAATMANQIPKQIKNERLNKLKSLVLKKFGEFQLKNIGTIQNVVFEKNKSSKTGMYKGLTGNYLKVYADSSKNLGSDLCNCYLSEIRDGVFICEPIKN